MPGGQSDGGRFLVVGQTGRGRDSSLDSHCKKHWAHTAGENLWLSSQRGRTKDIVRNSNWQPSPHKSYTITNNWNEKFFLFFSELFYNGKSYHPIENMNIRVITWTRRGL